MSKTINLDNLFLSIGVVDGNANARNQYEFFYGIEWSDGSFTYNEYDFYKKAGFESRRDFFETYADSEKDFYESIISSDIYDYRTYYENAGLYLSGIDWILKYNVWNDAGFWIDSELWND